jgi:hypothetical protein
MTTTDNAIIIYQSPDGAATLEVRLDHETVWLTQDQMAELFGRERSVITKHLRNVFKEGELEEDSVRAKYAHTAADGKEYLTQFYNLDAIISVGYGRYKDLLVEKNMLEDWYAFENERTREALLKWCERQGLTIESASDKENVYE